jgi:hypothetical protein
MTAAVSQPFGHTPQHGRTARVSEVAVARIATAGGL